MTLEEAYKVAEENIEMTAKEYCNSVENSIRKTLLNAGVFLLLSNNNDSSCFIKLTLYIE